MNATTAGTGSATGTDQTAARPLRQSTDDRMPAGVADGTARYLDADVALDRAIIAAPALFSGAFTNQPDLNGD